jgi:hypothetical protein
MIGVTLFGIFLTPVFFYVLMQLGSRKQAGEALVSQAAASPGDGTGAARASAEGPAAD